MAKSFANRTEKKEPLRAQLDCHGNCHPGASTRALVERPIDQVLDKLLDGGVYTDVKCTADLQALQSRGVEVWRL